MFPFEIVEHILRFCDGRTLKTATKVSTLWNNAVQYLTKETDIWEWCCYNDIPKHEFVQMKQKFHTDKTGRTKWLQFYESWLNWCDDSFEVIYKNQPLLQISQITCICTNYNFLVLGFKNGVVKIFNDKFVNTKTFRHMNVPIESIYLYEDKISTNLLIYSAQRVYIHDFYDFSIPHNRMINCYTFSHYNEYLCGVSSSGYINISRLVCGKRNIDIEVVYYGRVYSDGVLNGCGLLGNNCLVLLNDKVYDIDYTKASVAIEPKDQSAYLDFCYSDDYKREYYIYNNEVIIALTRTANLQKQLLELFILNKSGCSKKLFVPWHTYKGFVSCVHLYSKMLIVGLTNGFIYIYDVIDWKLFNVVNYSYKVKVGNFIPIVSIDVVEKPGQRDIYVCTTSTIHKLSGCLSKKPLFINETFSDNS